MCNLFCIGRSRDPTTHETITSDWPAVCSHVAVSATIARPIVVSVVPRPPVHCHGSGPGWIQVGSLGLDSGTYELVILRLIYSELEFPQHMVVDVPRITAFLKQHARILKPRLLIFFEDEVRAHRKHNGKGVRIRFDIRLRVKPIKHAEAHCECLLSVFLVLRKCTCIHDRIGSVHVWFDVWITFRLIQVPQIGQNHLCPPCCPRFSTLCPRINNTGMRPRVGLVALVSILILLLHDLQDFLCPRCRSTISAFRQRIDQCIVRVSIWLHVNVPAAVQIIHVVKNLLGTLGPTAGSAPSPGVNDCIKRDSIRLDISIPCLVESVHPLKDGLSAFGGRLALTRLRPSIKNSVEVYGRRLHILAAVGAEAVDHVVQDTFCASSGTRFSTLGKSVDNSIVGESVGFKILIASSILSLHLIQKQVSPGGCPTVSTLSISIDHSCVSESIRLQTGESTRMKAIHGHQHLLGLSSSTTLLALRPGIDHCIKHIGVGPQVRMTHWIALVESNHVRQQSVRTCSSIALHGFGKGINHSAICHHVGFD
mmetsp:Transcript_8243/g.17605  ORF Transcript_8243/g.17605 Transcript_8243/m.17605 type:complete len:538 (-) Transcript_8243:3458-5071(-)